MSHTPPRVRRDSASAPPPPVPYHAKNQRSSVAPKPAALEKRAQSVHQEPPEYSGEPQDITSPPSGSRISPWHLFGLGAVAAIGLLLFVGSMMLATPSSNDYTAADVDLAKNRVRDNEESTVRHANTERMRRVAEARARFESRMIPVSPFETPIAENTATTETAVTETAVKEEPPTQSVPLPSLTSPIESVLAPAPSMIVSTNTPADVINKLSAETLSEIESIISGPRVELPQYDTVFEQRYLDDDVSELRLFRLNRTARNRIESLAIDLRSRQSRAKNNASFDVFNYVDDRRDFQGIPFIMGDECHVENQKAMVMSRISSAFGAARNSIARNRRVVEERPDFIETQRESMRASGQMTEEEIEAAIERMYGNFEGDGRIKTLINVLDRELDLAERKDPADVVSTFVQLLQAEDLPLRNELVRLLSEIPGTESSQALANLASFDLDDEIRDAAIEVLRERDPSEYRDVLMENLWYPWTPVSTNAADSLVKVGHEWLDKDSVVETLTEMLDRPDPKEPFKNEQGTWVTNELVKVNHLRSCLLCHEPKTTGGRSRDQTQVTGLIPVPDQQIPVQYYHSQSGSFVDASTTYLRQDFSTMEKVRNPGEWPEMQRHDFFVRQRPLTAPEIHACETRQQQQQQQQEPQQSAQSPQESDEEPEQTFAQKRSVEYVIDSFARVKDEELPVESLSERARIERVREMLKVNDDDLE